MDLAKAHRAYRMEKADEHERRMQADRPVIHVPKSQLDMLGSRAEVERARQYLASLPPERRAALNAEWD